MQVGLVSPPQRESLVELLGELHSYYNEGSPVPAGLVRAHLVDNLLGPDSPLRLVVACDHAVDGGVDPPLFGGEHAVLVSAA